MATLAAAQTLPSHPAHGGVWDRVWRHQASASKDNAALHRERSSRRWAAIDQAVRHAFGGFDGLRTIELGSGRGDWSALFAQHGAAATLVDASATALHQARQRFVRLGLRARYLHGDIFHQPNHRGGQYDVALSLGVIEHFSAATRTRILQAHADVLRPGGLAIVGVPNALCPAYRVWKMLLEIPKWWPYGYEAPYTPRELRRRALQAGLTDTRVVTTGFYQSIGDCLMRGLLHIKTDLSPIASALDDPLGMNLLLIARLPGDDIGAPPAQQPGA